MAKQAHMLNTPADLKNLGLRPHTVEVWEDSSKQCRGYAVP